jgi:hypothetical protein
MMDKKSFILNINQEENLSKNYYSNNAVSESRKVNFEGEKLKSKNDRSTLSKDHSTVKMNLNKPLKINPRSLLIQVEKNENKEIFELLEDNELKEMHVNKMEENLKSTFSTLEKEIELIKAKYQNKIKKYSVAIDFLKANPHLKNLKEYEKYAKFSKNLDQSKFSMYSGKSNNDESIGGTSLLPLNRIKVNQYKDNNINEKNK